MNQKISKMLETKAERVEYLQQIRQEVGKILDFLRMFASQGDRIPLELNELIEAIQPIEDWTMLFEELHYRHPQPKKLCLKYKRLDHRTLIRLKERKICWKYVRLLLDQALSVITIEIENLIPDLEHLPPSIMKSSCASKLKLLCRVAGQFNAWLSYGCIVDEDDIMQRNDDDPLHIEVDEWKQIESIGDTELIASKYSSMGTRLRNMNLAFHVAENSFTKAMLSFPVFTLSKTLAEREVSAFLCSPKQAVLSTVWNLASVRLADQEHKAS